MTRSAVSFLRSRITGNRIELRRDVSDLRTVHERERNLADARAAYTRVVESTVLSIELAWARPIAQARLAAIGR